MKELTNLQTLNNKKLLTILPLNKVNEKLLSELSYSLADQDFKTDLLILSNLSDADNELLKKAIENPKIVRPKSNKEGNVVDDVQELSTYPNYSIEKTTSETFQKVFNEAFNYAIRNDYEWFTVVEPDDFVYKNFYKYFDTFSNDKSLEYDGYMPLAREISNAGFVSYFNEATWVEGLAEVAGTFDLNLLLRFNCMNITGAIFKTESIKKVCDLDNKYDKTHVFSPIKESIKINYSYEFFLRLIYNDLKFYTIPRLGYDRRSFSTMDAVDYFTTKMPPDIITKSTEKGGISADEYKFWNDLAKKEYFFEDDRAVKYEAK